MPSTRLPVKKYNSSTKNNGGIKMRLEKLDIFIMISLVRGKINLTDNKIQNMQIFLLSQLFR